MDLALSDADSELPVKLATELFPRRTAYCLCVVAPSRPSPSELERLQSLSSDMDVVLVAPGGHAPAALVDSCRVAGLRALLTADSAQPGDLLRAALAYASSQGYDGAVTATASDPGLPLAISALTRELDAGFDLVHAVQGSEKAPGWLAPRAHLRALLLSVAGGAPYTDAAVHAAAFSRRILSSAKMAPLRAVRGDDLHAYLAIEAGRLAFRVAEVRLAGARARSGRLRGGLGESLSIARILRIAGGAYRPDDPYASASSLERMVLAVVTLVPQLVRRLRKRSTRRSRSIALALLLLCALSFVLQRTGIRRPPSPRFEAAGECGPGCERFARASSSAAPRAPLELAAPWLAELDELTVEFWYRPWQAGLEHRLARIGGANNEQAFLLSGYAAPTGNLGVQIGTPNIDGAWGSRSLTSGASDLIAGQWHHVVGAISWRRGKLASFVDGKPVILGVIPSGTIRGITFSKLEIGTVGAEPPIGEFGAVRVYDRFLQPFQARALVDDSQAWLPSEGMLSALGMSALLGFVILVCLGRAGAAVARGGLVLAMIALLQSSFAQNGAGIATDSWFDSYERFSEKLVFPGIVDKRPKELVGPLAGYGLGWIEQDLPDRYYAGALLTAKALPAKTYKEYTSQIGIQSRLLRNLRPFGKLLNRWDVGMLQECVALATATVLSLLAFGLGRSVSFSFGAGLYLALLCSAWLTVFARNLYWMPWLWFLPSLAVVLTLGNRSWSKTNVSLAGLGVAAAVCLKSMAGYEYLSAVVLSACAMAFAVRQPMQLAGKVELVRRGLMFLYIGACSVFGFLCALLVHARIRGGGVLSTGLHNIFYEDVLRRTMNADPAKFDPVYEASFRARVSEVLSIYFDGAYTPGVRYDTALAAFVCIALVWLLYRSSRDPSRTAERSIDSPYLLLFVVASLAASLSWFVLAKSHSYIHRHMNFVVWSVLFVPALAGFTAELVRVLVRRRLGSTVAPQLSTREPERSGS